jgi:Phosphoinositide phospholipase C, Ca2+-dependent
MALLAGCSGDDSDAPPGSGCGKSVCTDAGRDVGSPEDDGGSEDTGSTSDSGSSEGSAATDGGATADTLRDSVTPSDARTDSGTDGGRPPDDAADARAIDAADGGRVDAGPDATPPNDGNGGGTSDAGDLDDVLHMNDIQMEGTHNSYHIETTGGIIPAWHYTHQPLDVQLTMQGVRQFELDFHYNGPNDFPVHHVPPDVGSTCKSLPECLGVLKTWSDAHPRHAPLVVLLEQKDELDIFKISGHYDEVDALLLSVWPRERIITPDEVRGQRATLREAVTTDGWPLLGKARGRILFAFIGDSTEYMNGHPNLENRVVFPRATVSDPFAAFVLLDNAQNSETEIADAVRQGFIVRTRYNGEELKLVPAVLDAAHRGGAQCVSGDFPVDFSITGGAPLRCNPLRAPAACSSAAIERL